MSVHLWKIDSSVATARELVRVYIFKRQRCLPWMRRWPEYGNKLWSSYISVRLLDCQRWNAAKNVFRSWSWRYGTPETWNKLICMWLIPQRIVPVYSPRPIHERCKEKFSHKSKVWRCLFVDLGLSIWIMLLNAIKALAQLPLWCDPVSAPSRRCSC